MGTDALISLLLAVLVDVLSLLFAMIFVRQRSVLAAKNTDQAIVGDEDLFERNIITALRLGMCAEGRAFSEAPDMDEVTDRLGDFLCRFSAVDFAAEKGYTLAASREEVSLYEPLVAFLCQFGLAKVLSSEDAELFGVSSTDDTVLLKTKFMLWVSEKTAVDALREGERTKKPQREKDTDISGNEPFVYTGRTVTE